MLRHGFLRHPWLTLAVVVTSLVAIGLNNAVLLDAVARGDPMLAAVAVALLVIVCWNLGSLIASAIRLARARRQYTRERQELLDALAQWYLGRVTWAEVEELFRMTEDPGWRGGPSG